MNKENFKSFKQFIEDNKAETHRVQSKFLGETLKDIAKSIDSIIARQQIKINELNEQKFK